MGIKIYSFKRLNHSFFCAIILREVAMNIEEYLEKKLKLKKGKGKEILNCISSFKKEKNQNRLKKISIPNYSLGEEIFNSVSHGI